MLLSWEIHEQMVKMLEMTINGIRGEGVSNREAVLNSMWGIIKKYERDLIKNGENCG